MSNDKYEPDPRVSSIWDYTPVISGKKSPGGDTFQAEVTQLVDWVDSKGHNYVDMIVQDSRFIGEMQ